MRTNPQRWLRVVALSLRQHGNVTREQLLDAGFVPSQITRLVRNGHLHRVYRGVYAVGRPPQHALERATAAVLACGATAGLGHRPALALWDLAEWPANVAEVVVTEDRRPSGICVHQYKLLPRDFRRRHGIRVTSPARTILDCAPSLSERTLTRTVNDALRAKYLRSHHLKDLLDRCPTHPGAPQLYRFLDSESGLTRSELEDLFLALCARCGLPKPKINTTVNGYEVDAYFEAEQLIVELDGWTYHNSRESFERDRARDADAYEALGIPTIRITGDRLKQQPEREARRLQTILARRRAELSRASGPARRPETP